MKLYIKKKWYSQYKTKSASRWQQITVFIRVIQSFIQSIRSNGWFIQKLSKWLSSWMAHWIIDSLDSFKNVDSLMKHHSGLIRDTQQFS